HAVQLDLIDEQRLRGALPGRLGIGVDEIELRAVAGREAHCLAFAGHPPCEFRRTGEVERDALTHLNGRQSVRRADENEAHAKCPIWRLNCMATTSANRTSVTYAARRPCQPAPNRRARNAP